MGGTGPFQTAVLPEKTAICKEIAAKSDTLLAADDFECGPDLARLAAAWPALDETARRQILTIAGL
jgi:hypothetical protein